MTPTGSQFSQNIYRSELCQKKKDLDPDSNIIQDQDPDLNGYESDHSNANSRPTYKPQLHVR
jgi:hypothetical protein